MRLLLHSRFPPHTGGIETLANLLAREWSLHGLHLAVLSDLPAPPRLPTNPPCPLFHRPGLPLRLRLHRQSQLVVHMNLSLKALWPLLLFPRPFVAVHHGFYRSDTSRRRSSLQLLKLAACRTAHANIAVSRALARSLPLHARVIPNAYDDSLFYTSAAPHGARTLDLAFVGRLVSQKGAALLLTALQQLRLSGLKPTLTIIGDGPQRSRLEHFASAAGLATQVRFLGSLAQPDVAAQLRLHKILVVPSLYPESFGIVALEAAACACVPLGSDTGGLPEAIGPSGLTFRTGDPSALSEKLAFLLRNPAQCESFRAAATAHLARHRPQLIAAQYLQVFRKVLTVGDDVRSL